MRSDDDVQISDLLLHASEDFLDSSLIRHIARIDVYVRRRVCRF